MGEGFGSMKKRLLSRRWKLQKLQVNVRRGGTKFARNKKVNYLGVEIDDRLTWQDQVEAVRRKCFAGLAKLKRLRNVLPSSIKKIFCALVQPHLDYRSVVWQECSLELKLRLDRVQNCGMRLILSKTPSEGLRKITELDASKALEERCFAWYWYTGV